MLCRYDKHHAPPDCANARRAPGLFRARPQPSSTSKLLNQPTFPIPPFVRAIRSDKKLAPLPGKSLTPLLAGKTESVRTEEDWIGEELFGNGMERQGDWKLCYIMKTAGGSGEWELFNLKNDPGETTDLSKKEPEKTKAMLTLWDKYVAQNGVILTSDGPFKPKP